MATDRKPMNQWNLNDYLEYFAHSSRLSGVATSFREINDLMIQKRTLEQGTVNKDSLTEWESQLDQIKSMAEKYVKEHVKPMTSDGKKRKEVMQALVNYCDSDKQLTSSQATAQTFRGMSFDNLRTGITYDNIEQLTMDMSDIESREMTEENVMEFVNKASQLVLAAESYMNAHPGTARLTEKRDLTEISRMQGGPRKNPYDFAEALVEYYKPCLESARDLRKVREILGKEQKSWSDITNLRTAHYEMQEKGQVVGANVSQRIKMTHNGKTGFFTESETVQTFSEIYNHALNTSSEPERRAILEATKDLIKKNWKPISGSGSRFVIEQHVFTGVAKVWDGMNPSKQKDELKELLLKDPKGEELTNIFKDYRKKTSARQGTLLSDDEKKRLLKETLEERKVPSELSSLMLNSSKELCNYADGINFGLEDKGKLKSFTFLEYHGYSSMLSADLSKEEGRKQFEATQALMHNGALKSEVVSMAKKAGGFYAAAGDAGNLAHGSELSGRNVASSRIAELLGVGNLLAHSEKMTVTMPDGKTVEGCFMEFAEGLDLRNGGDKAVMESGRLSLTRNPGFMRDACNLEILDFICAQGDRHGGNMFVKLGEVKEDGTREIVGIQGIDNDLAFTDASKFNVLQDSLDNLHLIDEAMAQRILGIDRSKLDAVVGDILTDKEMDALCDRFDKVKVNIRTNMIQLKGAQWNLDADPKTYGDKAHLYEKALSENEKAFNAKYPWQRTHKQAFINDELKAAKAKYDKESELLESVSHMFEQAETEAKEAPKLDDEKVKRAALFDQIVFSKGAVKETSAAETPAKAVKEKEQTSFRKMSAFDKSKDKGVRFGDRSSNAKSRDLEFEEITKEDIKRANERQPKVIIGANRGRGKGK